MAGGRATGSPCSVGAVRLPCLVSIAKLKAEEAKAKKEIEKTVKRTNEILASRGQGFL